jgi:hypothetical protein
MAVDPYIARGVQPIDYSNTLAQVAALRQRDQSLAQDQQLLGMRQQQYTNTLAQDEEDDAEWDRAYAAKDWAGMARIDPQTTKILYEHEQAQKPPTPVTEQTLPSGRVLATQGGKPIGQPWAAPDPHGGMGQMEPFDVQTYKYYLNQSPETQARILEYRRGNSTPEITRDTAEARALGAKAGERQAEIDKKISNFANMNDALDIASTLIPVATGSAVGALADRAAGAFGFTPTGAEATASLRVLAAKVLENVPRMEGPQSDRDVQMYREAAGQLGEPSVTRAEKMAAIKTIRQLTTKYSVRNRGAAPSGGSTGSTPPTDRLKEGVVTTFKNGQKWTLRGGQPVQVQ